MGASTDDPVLAVIARWWTIDRLNDFLAWAAAAHPFTSDRPSAWSVTHQAGDTETTPLPDRFASRRSRNGPPCGEEVGTLSTSSTMSRLP